MSNATAYVKKQLKQKEKANPTAYKDPAKKKPAWTDHKSKKK